MLRGTTTGAPLVSPVCRNGNGSGAGSGGRTWDRLVAAATAGARLRGLEQAWLADADTLREQLAKPTRLGDHGLAALLAYREAIGPTP